MEQEQQPEEEQSSKTQMIDINAKLIQVVQKYPTLYNQENVSPEIKLLYWKEVAIQLKDEPDPSKEEVVQVRQRWKNLRDSYVKDFKQVKLNERHNLVLPKRWRYAKQMEFLNPYISSKGPLKKMNDIDTKSVMRKVMFVTNRSKVEKTQMGNDELLPQNFSIDWITPYPEITVKENRLLCIACSRIIKADCKAKVDHHVLTSTHTLFTRKWQIEKAQQIASQQYATIPNNSQSLNNQPITSIQPATQEEESNDDDITLIENIKKEEEYDDIFDETVDDILPVSKEELMDIVNQSELSSNPEESLDSISFKKEPPSDQEDHNEPPSKKSKWDKPGPSNEFDCNHRLAHEMSNLLADKIQHDPALVRVLDSSGNIDLFFESILSLAKTLTPLNQVLLQKNVANVVFGMKIAELTKKKLFSS